jgi:hypothetical protein
MLTILVEIVQELSAIAYHWSGSSYSYYPEWLELDVLSECHPGRLDCSAIEIMILRELKLIALATC